MNCVCVVPVIVSFASQVISTILAARLAAYRKHLKKRNSSGSGATCPPSKQLRLSDHPHCTSGSMEDSPFIPDLDPFTNSKLTQAINPSKHDHHPRRKPRRYCNIQVIPNACDMAEFDDLADLQAIGESFLSSLSQAPANGKGKDSRTCHPRSPLSTTVPNCTGRLARSGRSKANAASSVRGGNRAAENVRDGPSH
ncbi:hypothetical protein AX15_003287 [Amanita polypyramis BW_CC]|nr:hypothetical protein AX15_003287 [Amanita polypyramis BW_CC]